jgi:outer membrane protein assembly factor BamE
MGSVRGDIADGAWMQPQQDLTGAVPTAAARARQCIIRRSTTLVVMSPDSMRKLLPAVVALLLTTACGVVYRQPIYQGNLLEKANVDQLQAGMDKQQVVLLLGTPSVADPYARERWDYTATQRVGRLARTEVKNLTLWFEGDRLARWEGEYFPEQDQALARGAVRQFGPNLAKDKDKQRRRR